MHYWMHFFGTNEAAIRFPSLLFGVLSIYLIFLLGKKIFDEKVGLLASYLLAVSTIHIYYSQNARPYSMVACFVLLSFLSFLEALRQNSRLAWSAYIASTLIALLLSTSALTIIICQAVFAIIFWSRHKSRPIARNIIFSFVFILAIYLPFLTRLVLSCYKEGELSPLSWLPKPTFYGVIDIFNLLGLKIYEEGPKSSWTTPRFFVTSFSIFLLLLYLRGIFTSLARGGTPRKIRLSPEVWLLVLWFWLPLILPFVLSYCFSTMFGEVRYALYIIFPYYVCISKGIVSLRGKARIVVMALIVIIGVGTLHTYYQVDKKSPDMIGPVSYLKKNIQHDERAACIIKDNNLSLHGEYRMMEYYSLPCVGLSLSAPNPELSKKQLIEICTPEQVPYKGLWIVTELPPFDKEIHRECINRIEKRYALRGAIEIPIGKKLATISHYRLKE